MDGGEDGLKHVCESPAGVHTVDVKIKLHILRNIQNKTLPLVARLLLSEQNSLKQKV